MLQPPKQQLGAFVIETKTIQLQAPAGTVPSGSVAAWTVECVISAYEGAPTILQKTLASGIVLVDATLAVWNVTFSETDLGETLGAGTFYLAFNRTDSGAGLVIARASFQIGAISTGAA